MWDYYEYHRYELTLSGSRIVEIKNLIRIDITDKFLKEVNEPNIAKLYLIRDNEFYQYIGTTFQPINARLTQGLKANGKNGYHGYKWKNKSKVELFVWAFYGLNKSEIENIEAEIAFKIRNKYGKWVLTQNEIHFNNDFIFGRVMAESIFNYIEDKYPLYKIIENRDKANIIFEEPFQYGLRGDPYLWKELKIMYESTDINSEDDFRNLLNKTFVNVTGEYPKLGKIYTVPRYNFGGMSNGGVHGSFWIEKGFPILIERFKKLSN